MSGARVMCMTPGCSVFFEIDVLDPRFPNGPFHCPQCVERLRLLKRPEGPPGRPDDSNSLAPVVLDDLSGDSVSVSVKVPKRW